MKDYIDNEVKYDLRDYLKMRLHLISRLFNLKKKVKNPKYSKILNPFDLIKHSNNSNIAWKYENGYLIYYCTKDLVQGEELSLCYGKKNNSLYLAYYGFTLPIGENRNNNYTKIGKHTLNMKTGYFEFSEAAIKKKLQSLREVKDSSNKNIHNAYISWKGEVEILKRLLEKKTACTYCENEGCSVCKTYGWPCVNCEKYCEPWV